MPVSQPGRSLTSISNRILLPYLVLIVALVAGTGLVAGRWAAARARGPYLDHGRGIVETLRRSNFPLNGPILRQLKGLGGAEFVLLDGRGEVRASTLDAAGPSAGGRSDTLRLPSSLVQPGQDFERTWRHAGVAYRVGVVERPADPDRVLVLLPEPVLKAAERDAWRAIGLFTAVGVALSAALAVAVGRTISRPLAAIVEATRRISHGDLEPRGLPVAARDEVGELARAIERMAAWLQRLQDEQIRTERLRLIRQVSAGLAHELRNPLTGARLALQLDLQRRGERDAEPIRVALDELSRMERQVRRFLQMARPEPPRREPTPIAGLLGRLERNLEAVAAHRGLAFEVDAAIDRPDLDVDPEQILQVLTNLAWNAFDAVGAAGRVRVRASSEGPEWAIIDVEDDGPGVAEADVGRLFEPFFTTRPEGVGLGLALARALVLEHGGRIAYDRRDGWTRFRVVLPAAAGPGGRRGAVAAGRALEPAFATQQVCPDLEAR